MHVFLSQQRKKKGFKKVGKEAWFSFVNCLN
jgi:hypothetical protein